MFEFDSWMFNAIRHVASAPCSAIVAHLEVTAITSVPKPRPITDANLNVQRTIS
jgi:hypothetical protein